MIASSPPPTASSCAGLAFDWPKLRGEELWVGLGGGGGGREGREQKREREERSRERGGQPDEEGGLYCTVLYVIGSCSSVSPRPTTVVVKIFPSAWS